MTEYIPNIYLVIKGKMVIETDFHVADLRDKVKCLVIPRSGSAG